MAKDDVKGTTPAATTTGQVFASLLFGQGEMLLDRGVALEIRVVPEDDKRAENVDSVLDIRKVTGGFEVDYIGVKVANRNVVGSQRTKVRRTTFFPFGTVRSASVKVD
jgi:hypothetical protein